MEEFLFGLISSLAASMLIILLTNRDELRYFVTSRRRYRHLAGSWTQYHLTTDSRVSNRPIWVSHQEWLKINAFGRVKGFSSNSHSTHLEYRITGTIRNGVMRLRFENQTVKEEPVLICYPNLLPTDILVGMWAGNDFDQMWSTGPIILSRTDLNEKRRVQVVLGTQRILVPVWPRIPERPIGK